MKIAYLAHTCIPSNVASSIHVMRMCQALADVKHDVTLFCPRAEDRPGRSVDPFDFYGVRRNFSFQWLPRPKSLLGTTIRLHRMVRFVTNWKSFDLVYARCQGLGTYKLHKLNRPFVLETHSLHTGPAMQRLVNNPWLRGLVVISESLERDYRRELGTAKCRIVLARDGADEAQPCTPRSLPGNNTTRCGYVGNLYTGKGLEILVPLAQRCPSVDFHVFGGKEEDVFAWRRKPEVENRPNLFFHGFVQPSETDSVRAACDMLIAPYQPLVHGVGGGTNIADWMSPLKLFEYMASGKAILASDLPVLREILRDRENSLLCPPQDLDAWVAAVEWVRDQPEDARQIGQRALSEFSARYSWRARAELLTREFQLDGRPRCA
jgi:glycosyltransferase involved in cell wall biosynthesis